MGSYKGLKQLRTIVIDCMKNIHPVYHIKTMMIKKELAKDPALANEDWTRFLPKFQKKNLSKRKKPHVINEKKAYTPFPPAPIPSKIDQQIESGEYFFNEMQRQTQKKVLTDSLTHYYSLTHSLLLTHSLTHSGGEGLCRQGEEYKAPSRARDGVYST